MHQSIAKKDRRNVVLVFPYQKSEVYPGKLALRHDLRPQDRRFAPRNCKNTRLIGNDATKSKPNYELSKRETDN